MVWQNDKGIQTNQNTRDDLVNVFSNGNYSASSNSFTNSAGGTIKFSTPVSTSGDLAAEIAKVNVENGTLANFYTFDGKANPFAWTGNDRDNIDGSNVRTNLIM